MKPPIVHNIIISTYYPWKAIGSCFSAMFKSCCRLWYTATNLIVIGHVKMQDLQFEHSEVTEDLNGN